jgi:hypothetical protein
MTSAKYHKINIISSEESQEVRDASRKLRQLKRQMFLKQVEEPPSSVDNFFRSFINVGLAIKHSN